MTFASGDSYELVCPGLVTPTQRFSVEHDATFSVTPSVH